MSVPLGGGRMRLGVGVEGQVEGIGGGVGRG